MAQDWAVAYLSALGAKPTPAAVNFLHQWQPYEGGATHNNASNNYLNTTENAPGATSINSVGVKAYPSLAIGAQAFARTLQGNPHYASLVSFLKTGKGDPTAGLATWVSGSPDSAHGLQYASKVLGTPMTTPAVSDGSLPTSQPVSLTAPDVGAQVHTQAINSLRSIATGGSATDEFENNIVPLLKTLHNSVPKVAIPGAVGGAPAQGGSALETSAANLVSKYLGVKYTWGGTNATTGFDCSGLVQTVYKQLGVNVPRTSEAQFAAGKPVNQLQPGDVVFFVGSDGTVAHPGHEGLYIGGGKYIAAPHTGAVVSVFNLADSKDYVGGRRFT